MKITCRFVFFFLLRSVFANVHTLYSLQTLRHREAVRKWNCNSSFSKNYQPITTFIDFGWSGVYCCYCRYFVTIVLLLDWPLFRSIIFLCLTSALTIIKLFLRFVADNHQRTDQRFALRKKTTGNQMRTEKNSTSNTQPKREFKF